MLPRPALAELRGRITKWAEAVDFSTRPDPAIPHEFGDREGDISLRTAPGSPEAVSFESCLR